MQTAYAIYLIITLAGTAILGVVGYYGWIHRKSGQVTGVFTLLIGIATFTNTMFLGLGLSSTYEAAFFFARARFLGITSVPVIIFYFSLSYLGYRPSAALTALCAFIPLLANLLLWTNDLHGAFYKSWNIYFTEGMVFESIEYGHGYHLYISYVYFLIVVALFALAVGIWRSRGTFRQQYMLAMLCFILILIFNIPSAFKLIPFSYPSLNQFSLLIIGFTLASPMVRFQVFDIRPIANDAVVSSLQDGVIVVHKNGYLAGINPAAQKLLGVSAASVLGLSLREAFETKPQWLGFLEQAQRDREPLDVQIEESGHICEIRMSPVRYTMGQTIGSLFLVRDVTELRRTQSRTLELDLSQAKMRMVNDFIDASSHDLRTPLTIIGTNLYLLRQDHPNLDRESRYRAIEQEIQNMSHAISQLHQLVALNQQVAIALSKFSLRTIREAVPKAFFLLAQKKNITLEWQLTPSLPEAMGDYSLIMTAFQNVLHNSLLYTPDGGTVTIRTFLSQEDVVIEVEDTGIGIDAEDHPKLFDEFFKADPARPSSEGGTGVGLTMVKKVMEIHGGRVDFTSSPGQGSTFRLLIPLTPKNALTQAHSDDEAVSV